MADITSAAPKTANPVASIANTLTAPFRAIGRGLIALAEAGPRAAALRRVVDEAVIARATERVG